MTGEEARGQEQSCGNECSRPLLLLALLGLMGIAGAAWPGASVTSAEPQNQPVFRSAFAVAYAPDGSLLAASDHTAGAAVIIDTQTGETRHHTPLRGAATDLVWTSRKRFWVAEQDAGTVAEIDADTGRVVRRLAVGPRPTGLSYVASRQQLLVTGSGTGELVAVDLERGSVSDKAQTTGQAWFVAAGDERAVVGNLLPVGDARAEDHAAAIDIFSLRPLNRIKQVKLPAGSSAVRGICMSPDGRWAYAVHTVGRVALPTTQLERGWVNTNALSIIDLQEMTWYATVLFDQVTQGAADPWGVCVAPDHKTLWVTLAGVHELVTVQLDLLHDALSGQAPAGLKPEKLWRQIAADPSARAQLVTDLTAMHSSNIVSRMDLPLQAPRDVAFAPQSGTLAIAGYYSGNIALLDAGSGRLRHRVPLGLQPEETKQRRGERLFHDGTNCLQGWLSCATCHPHGRADGLNWDLLNDGIGNAKNSKSLVWSDRTPPVMSLGVRSSSDVATAAGFHFIQFRSIDSADLECVRIYLRSLEPPTSPYRINGRLSPLAAKGQEVFADKRVGCAHCHPAPLFTNLRGYDVGTRHPADRHDVFDTPTLIELWRTAPYLHDGSAATLWDVLTTDNVDDRHGRTSHLSEEELKALEAYLLSL